MPFLSGPIYGELIVYNPRTDLLGTIPNSTFNTTGGFFTNTNSIESELCCVYSTPEPSSLVLAGIAAAAGLGLWARRRRGLVGTGKRQTD